MQKQVQKIHYNFKNYCSDDRFADYWNQINEVIDLQPSSVLEVGGGDKVFANYIQTNTDIKYTCLDIAEDLQPDIVGSVDDIPLGDNSVNVACAYEVLEHLPFDKFTKSLKELGRVSSGNIIISLPHWGRQFSIEIMLPFLGRKRVQFKISPFAHEHKFDGEHYWEIGKRGYSIRRIRNVIKDSGFDIKKDFISFQMPYHHFFVLNLEKSE